MIGIRTLWVNCAALLNFIYARAVFLIGQRFYVCVLYTFIFYVFQSCSPHNKFSEESNGQCSFDIFQVNKYEINL